MSTRPPMPQTAPIYSPCTSVCTMDAVSGYCKGCYRTIGEIARWSQLKDFERLQIWRQLDAREQSTKQGITSLSISDE